MPLSPSWAPLLSSQNDLSSQDPTEVPGLLMNPPPTAVTRFYSPPEHQSTLGLHSQGQNLGAAAATGLQAGKKEFERRGEGRGRNPSNSLTETHPPTQADARTRATRAKRSPPAQPPLEGRAGPAEPPPDPGRPVRARAGWGEMPPPKGILQGSLRLESDL